MSAEAKNTSVGRVFSRVGMISYSDGDDVIAGPFGSDQMTNERYSGSYPAPSIILKDGAILTFYSAKRRSAKNEKEFLAAAIRTNTERTGLEAPATLVDSLDVSDTHSPDVGCGGYFLSPTGAYDAEHDKVYYAYSDIRGGRCHLFLMDSSDGGRTWSKASQVGISEEAVKNVYANLSVAVNGDGTIGFLWRNGYRSSCWQFAASTDHGKTLNRAQQLDCPAERRETPSALSTAYLWTSVYQADPKVPSSGAMINLRDTWNSVWRNQNALVTTPDGAFHALWANAGDGRGELRTATIKVVSPDNLVGNAVRGLEDVTTRASILYGDDQSYDPVTKMLKLNIVVRNDSLQPFKGPLKLVVPSLSKDFGYVEIVNATNETNAAGAVWDMSSAMPAKMLSPGASTKPFTLMFRYVAKADIPRRSDDIFGLNVKIYAKQ